MKILLHRVGMWFYLLGYSVWVKIGKVMYWKDVMLVRESVHIVDRVICNEDIWNNE